jgi:hypothetical protein
LVEFKASKIILQEIVFVEHLPNASKAKFFPGITSVIFRNAENTSSGKLVITYCPKGHDSKISERIFLKMLPQKAHSQKWAKAKRKLGIEPE